MRTSNSVHLWNQTVKNEEDARDLKELLLESSWQPILSAIGGLWNTAEDMDFNRNATYDSQNARVGIDIAYEILSGASNLGRPDIFQDMFLNVCYMSGLLGDYDAGSEERALGFIHSIERQSAHSAE